MRKLLLALTITAVVSSVNAQQGHYFAGSIGGGVHNLNYNLGSKGGTTPGLGLSLGAGWQWFFSENFGVGVGLTYNTLKTTGKLNFTQSGEKLSDPDNGLTYNSTVVFSNLKEIDRQSVADIPLSLYYQRPLSLRLKLLAGVNLFYTAVLSQRYSTKGGYVSTGKYFPDYDLDYSGLDDKRHGIVTESDFSGNTRLKTSQFGTGAELMLCYAVGAERNVELTFGVYGAYRFTNQKQGEVYDVFDDKLLEYNGITQSNIADKVSSSNFGGSVGVRFRFGGRNKEKPLPPEPEPQPIVNTDTIAQPVTEPEPEPQVVEVTPEQRDSIAVVYDREELAEELEEIPPIEMKMNSTGGDPVKEDKYDKMVNALKSHPDRVVLIIGHTCDLGSLETNKRLGLQRAEAVKAELVKRGVNPAQIRTESRWYKEPLVPNTSEENRKKNRRVEIKVLD